ncbi:MAG: hypothetical protein ACJA0Y_001368, partial [Maricaulis maris]
MVFHRSAGLLAGASLLALSLAVPPASIAASMPLLAKTAVQADDVSASAAFNALIEDFEAFEHENSPGARARDGDLEAAGQWYDVSEASLDAQATAEANFLQRLEAIDAAALDDNERISHAVLDYILRFRVELAPFDEARRPFNNDSGFFSAPSYASASTRLRTIDRADAWVTRINAIPGFFDANIEWMRRGLADGFTQPRLIAEL